MLVEARGSKPTKERSLAISARWEETEAQRRTAIATAMAEAGSYQILLAPQVRLSADGTMFWFRRKKLLGSYFALSCRNR
jgi:hypothetical protein